MSLHALAVLSLLAGSPQQALPQQPPAAQAQEPATDLGEVTIEGRRLAGMARDFVGEIAAPAQRRGLARWRGDICVGVANLESERAQYVADRISTVAEDLGLSPGQPGCRANILVVFADDGQALAAALVDHNRRAFHLGVSGLDRGGEALERFAASIRPVRWWQVSLPVDRDTRERAVRLPGDLSPPVTTVRGVSRLNSQVVDELNKTIVIVDVDLVAGADIVQLADYVAMVSLAQVDPDADTTGFDTVLNVFSDPGSAPGLTPWDWSYLHALYGSERMRQNPGSIAGEVADGLARSRRSSDEAE
ncbi:hypothetical protein [Brevundimonas sp.]|uniref:hypothetical protein n=1 Tax=Brevundimonas sp. TaxID=1871086 RepID=UPI002D62A734|nr:hypothetical protein [Brevundimonas sp.]HYD28273.1 hypothetical protein [Brevundimonas sp.]